MRIIASTFIQSHRILSRLPRQIRPSLLYRSQFHFSEDSALLMDKGSLQVRNSETYELKLIKFNPNSSTTEPISLQFTNLSTINDMAEQFKTHFGIDNLNVFCEDGTVVSKWAPVEALLNRIFTIVSEDYRIRVEGQFLHSDIDAVRSHKIYELKENLSQLELPVLAQRQIESYINRVNIWLDAKYGSEDRNPSLKIKSKEIQDILVQSILDPQCKWRAIAKLEEQWRQKYWQIVELRQKKEKAIELSEKMAKRKMIYGLGLLAANIGFIWSGTYVFFSWDIIEPIAYFSSSLVGIILFGQVLKLRKPFSLQNYKQFLSNSYLQQASRRVDLNLSDLNSRQAQLQDIESILKDYLIVKL